MLAWRQVSVVECVAVWWSVVGYRGVKGYRGEYIDGTRSPRRVTGQRYAAPHCPYTRHYVPCLFIYLDIYFAFFHRQVFVTRFVFLLRVFFFHHYFFLPFSLLFMFGYFSFYVTSFFFISFLSLIYLFSSFPFSFPHLLFCLLFFFISVSISVLLFSYSPSVSSIFHLSLSC